MTTALLETPRSLSADGHRFGPAAEGGATLAERLERAWRAAQTDGRAECPVCRVDMRFEGGAARCTGCGSTLS